MGVKFLELSQRLYSYWGLQQNRLEKGQLIKALLSNCTIKDATLCPTYRKPFDLIFQIAETENWGVRRPKANAFGIPLGLDGLRFRYPVAIKKSLARNIPFWGGRRELNPQPQDPQSCALTKLSYAHREPKALAAVVWMSAVKE